MIPVPVGSPAPRFQRVDGQGRRTELEGMMGRCGVLLVFYPSDWGQVCHQVMVELRDMRDELESLGRSIVGISYNDVFSHGVWSERLRLNFPLVSDRDCSIAAAYGVLDDDPDSYNFGRPLRAFFLVSQGLIVQWSLVQTDLWPQPDYDAILEAARRFGPRDEGASASGGAA